MQQPTLYLFIGYPGAGKTSIARIIAERTAAKHLWADNERLRLFKHPTHSQSESHELYERLNEAADYLLSQGKSVIFDTNFNFASDRQHLRRIAEKHAAQTVVIWVTTPEVVARQRAIKDNNLRNGYPSKMSEKHFTNIVEKLEAPDKNETVIKIDGTKLDETAVIKQLGL